MQARTLLLVVSLFLATGALTSAQQSEESGAKASPFVDGNRILFLGDSITQAGGYIAFIETYLWARYPDRNLTFINMGVSAETVSHTTEPGHPPRPWVHDRVYDALEIAKPDWVFICYGMNDGNYYPPRRDIQKAYIDQTRRLLKRIEPTKAKVILMSPPPFDPVSKPAENIRPPGEESYGYKNTYRLYDDTLIYLGGIAQGTFGDDVHDFIDIHTPLQDYIENNRKRDAGYLYGDGVHPTVDGHLVWALAMLKALGEDPDAAYKTLHKLTGIPLLTDSDPVTPVENHAALRAGLMQRFNELSTVYRDNTRPETRDAKPDLEEALAKAAEREKQLRPMINAALAEPVPAAP